MHFPLSCPMNHVPLRCLYETAFSTVCSGVKGFFHVGEWYKHQRFYDPFPHYILNGPKIKTAHRRERCSLPFPSPLLICMWSECAVGPGNWSFSAALIEFCHKRFLAPSTICKRKQSSQDEIREMSIANSGKEETKRLLIDQYWMENKQNGEKNMLGTNIWFKNLFWGFALCWIFTFYFYWIAL